MPTWHSIELTAGPYSWTVYPDQPASEGDLLDELRISTNWEEGNPVHGQNRPWSASFGIVVAHMRDLVDLTIGAPVDIRVWYDAPGSYMPWPAPDDAIQRPPLAHFIGRISDLDARPASKGRSLVRATCTDYLVDLAQRTVGAVNWPQETAQARYERICREANIPTDPFEGYGTVALREAQPVTALEALTDLCRSGYNPVPSVPWLLHFPALNVELIDPLSPDYSFGKRPDPNLPYIRAFAYKDHIGGSADNPSGLPGLLAQTGAGVDVVLDPRYNDVVIPAGMCDLGVEWRKSRADRVDQVTVVSGDDPAITYDGHIPGSVPVDYRITSQLISSDLGPQSLVQTYLPPQFEDAWAFDKLTILDLPAQIALTWLAAYFARNGYRTNVVIDGLVEGQNPNGKTWLVGVVENAQLVFTGGDWTIDVTLRPDVVRPFPASSSPPYLSYANLAADPTLSATRLVDCAPDLTYHDLRIARRPE